MSDEDPIRERLLALQTELQQRLDRTQSEERHEVEEREDTTAQLWEASEIRDGLNDEAVSELRDVNRALARLDLAQFMDVPCHSLSAGQRRRVGLARLTLGGGRLWLLDEPFTALDINGTGTVSWPRRSARMSPTPAAVKPVR